MSSPLDLVEPVEQTALVCVDDPDLQALVIKELTDLRFKVNTGFSSEDLSIKLDSQIYNLVIIDENLDGQTLESNAIFAQAISVPSDHRREQFTVLLGAAVKTGDEFAAFKHSVDLVVNKADIAQIRPLLRRSLARTLEFYAAYHQICAGSNAI